MPYAHRNYLGHRLLKCPKCEAEFAMPPTRDKHTVDFKMLIKCPVCKEWVMCDVKVKG